MMATGAIADVVELGIFGPGQFIPTDELSAGNGWIHYRKPKEC